MTEHSNQPSVSVNNFKRRRAVYVCDFCSLKRIKCNASISSNNICDNCSERGLKCTVSRSAHKDNEPTNQSQSYVTALETRVAKLESLLQDLQPGILSGEDTSLKAIASTQQDEGDAHFIDVSRNDDDESISRIGSRFDDFALSDLPHTPLFWDKASGAYLAHVALQHLEVQNPGNTLQGVILDPFPRRDFWQKRLQAHELAQSAIKLIFPPVDLLYDLVDLYFENLNIFWPLLHRPSFGQNLYNGLHIKDNSFGGVVLLVCALGARFSNDPRIVAPGEPTESAGCQWYEQVRIHKTPFVAKPTLYDIQCYVLNFLFQGAIAAVEYLWVDIGLGLRLAQDIGAHRKRASVPPNTSSELWKRAVWILMYIDRRICAVKGRPCVMDETQFDLDLPIDCDDEFWEHPNPDMNFSQPPGQPSKVSAFISMLGNSRIQLHALRTIYAIRRPQWPSLAFPKSESDMVAELDSAMNKWLTTIPDHLLWEANQDKDPSDVFRRQSAQLHMEYYHLQMLVHRPFIPTPESSSWISSSSLAICTTASRGCLRIARALHRPDIGWHGQPMIHLSLFYTALILLLNGWRSSANQAARYLSDARTCIEILQSSNWRWLSHINVASVLVSLAQTRSQQIQSMNPQSQPRPKRQRESEDQWQTYIPQNVEQSLQQDSQENTPGSSQFDSDIDWAECLRELNQSAPTAQQTFDYGFGDTMSLTDLEQLLQIPSAPGTTIIPDALFSAMAPVRLDFPHEMAASTDQLSLWDELFPLPPGAQ